MTVHHPSGLLTFLERSAPALFVAIVLRKRATTPYDFSDLSGGVSKTNTDGF
jgi:hypothetical protein